MLSSVKKKDHETTALFQLTFLTFQQTTVNKQGRQGRGGLGDKKYGKWLKMLTTTDLVLVAVFTPKWEAGTVYLQG